MYFSVSGPPTVHFKFINKKKVQLIPWKNATDGFAYIRTTSQFSSYILTPIQKLSVTLAEIFHLEISMLHDMHVSSFCGLIQRQLLM